MSNLEKLIAKGAYSAAGDVVFKNKSMGKLRDGEFFISEDGLAELEVVDVEVKEVKPKAKKSKVEAPVESAEPLIDDLGELLGE